MAKIVQNRLPTRRAVLLYLLLVLFPIQNLFCAAQFEFGHPSHRSFTTHEYGGHPEIWSGVQDRSGALLFGNENCVLEYDGQGWDRIPVPGGYPIRGLARDSQGMIWAGGMNQLGHLEPEGSSYKFTLLKPGTLDQPSFGEVITITACGDAVYIRTKEALEIWRAGHGHAIPWPHGDGFHYIVAATSSRVFVHAKDEPLFEMLNDRLEPVSEDARIESTVVYQVLELDPETILLVTKNNGFFKLTRTGLEPFPTDVDPLIRRYNLAGPVTLAGGYIAVTLSQRGLVFIDLHGRIKGAFFRENGLPDPNILSMFSDRSQGLWTCQYTGLTRIELNPAISYFDAQNGLSNSWILNLERFQGQMYAATVDGLFRLQQATVETLPARFQAVAGSAPRLFALADCGDELLAGGEEGVFLYDGKELQHLPIPVGQVISLTRSTANPERVYVASSGGLAAISRTKGAWHLEGVLRGFDGEVARVIEQTPTEILVASVSGFFRIKLREGNSAVFDGATVTPLSDIKGPLPPGDTPDIFAINGSLALVSERGIYSCDEADGRFSIHSAFSKVFDKYLVKLAAAGVGQDGHIWLALSPRNGLAGKVSETEIARIDADGHLAMLSHAVYRTIGDPSAIKEEANGEGSILWISGTYGIARIDLSQAFVPVPAFNLFAREASTASGTSVPLPDAGHTLSLPFDSRDIRIRFANDRFSEPETIRYQMKLEGREKNWSPPLTDPVWRSGYLNEGRYELHVKAEDEDGILTQEAILSIDVSPPWYRTWWMYSIYGALSILCILGFVRVRVWRLRVREKELVAIVEKRTSELQESQARLVNAKEAAETANRAKSAFLANISHELRTPLNSILGYAQLMLRDDKEPAEKRRRLTTIQSSGEHLLNMINEILDLAKVESGTIVIKPQPVQLKSLLNTVADELQLRASQKRLRFTYSADQSIQDWISTDPVRLRQVLYNLVGNSIKFTESGEVSLAIHRVGDRIRIEVRDTGKGIPANDLQHLFKPFYQASNNDQASGGVGLGLHISHRIVRLLGSELRVTSTEGRGSVFWFELPAGELKETSTTAPLHRVVSFVGENRKLLVVDDDASNRLYMVELLREVGLEPKVASSVEDALGLIRSERFDAVLSDIRMAETNGITFCHEVRADPELASLVMIASSASVYVNDRETALAAGFNGFVPKPVNESLLFGLFEKLLGLKPVYGISNGAQADFQGTEDAISRPLTEALPDPAQLDQLLRYAKLGDVIALRAMIQKLSKENPALRTFCRRLSILAEKYQMSGVEKILEAAKANGAAAT